jgi:small subunit ribosomal protein S3
MGAGAMGVEITISGKLRGERAHFEKHTAGVIPKSGKIAEEVVRSSINSILTKMGLVGIKLKISLREEIPRDFDLITESPTKSEPEVENQSENKSPSEEQKAPSDSEVKIEGKDIINSEVKEIAVNKSET